MNINEGQKIFGMQGSETLLMELQHLHTQ